MPDKMIELYRSPWRSEFQKALRQVRKELTIVTPFIKESEAAFVCDQLRSLKFAVEPCVKVATDLRAENILAGSLDMDALKTFQESLKEAVIVTLPHLHAKVYLIDSSLAIVSSANLTSWGLDSNYEYGVGISDASIVRRIKADMESYMRLGNVVGVEEVEELSTTAKRLSAEYRAVQKTAANSAMRRFADMLQATRTKFIGAQVGTRSANAIFSEAVLYVLSSGPLSTRRLHPRIQRLLPDICDDSMELIIHGNQFGKVWKHQVRIAQQHLKRQGLISFDGKSWRLA
ncbi:MAG: phospholipase D-like domain-containing protein [bacterium]